MSNSLLNLPYVEKELEGKYVVTLMIYHLIHFKTLKAMLQQYVNSKKCYIFFFKNLLQ